MDIRSSSRGRRSLRRLGTEGEGEPRGRRGSPTNVGHADLDCAWCLEGALRTRSLQVLSDCLLTSRYAVGQGSRSLTLPYLSRRPRTYTARIKDVAVSIRQARSDP
jgi:hypothetical protein